ncbi:hypothetical protein BD414DRAFT_540846 [Trametes punicea]|nr:hypothetical protein BD414DRAFT_540846 [Trametes punicea]
MAQGLPDTLDSSCTRSPEASSVKLVHHLSRSQRREQTLRKLTYLIKENFGDMYDVRPFGSTCYGASSRDSDIDVVIFPLIELRMASGPMDLILQTPGHYLVGISIGSGVASVFIEDSSQVAQLLQDNGYTHVSCIPNAAVPIVKLTDPETEMSCDMNVNRRLGLYNTALLRQYCLRCPGLSKFLREIKIWVKSVNLNNPAVDGLPPSFSSYAITLMTVALYQDMGFLPNLQADKDPILQTHFWELHGDIHRKVDVRFGACKSWESPRWQRRPSMSQWFRFWAHDFDYKKSMISIRHGGFIRRPRQTQGYLGNIVVLDPFIDKVKFRIPCRIAGSNCTRRIEKATLKEFREKCDEMYRKLRADGRQDLPHGFFAASV